MGLSVSKSGELIQGALAILKAGCAYVPLDPHYPPDRLRYLIDDSGARLIIADASSADAVRATGASDLSFIDPFDNALEQHAQSSVHSSHATMDALSITAQQLSETRLKLALIESERDELEFQLMQKS